MIQERKNTLETLDKALDNHELEVCRVGKPKEGQEFLMAGIKGDGYTNSQGFNPSEKVFLRLKTPALAFCNGLTMKVDKIPTETVMLKLSPYLIKSAEVLPELLHPEGKTEEELVELRKKQKGLDEEASFGYRVIKKLYREELYVTDGLLRKKKKLLTGEYAPINEKEASFLRFLKESKSVEIDNTLADPQRIRPLIMDGFNEALAREKMEYLKGKKSWHPSYATYAENTVEDLEQAIKKDVVILSMKGLGMESKERKEKMEEVAKFKVDGRMSKIAQQMYAKRVGDAITHEKFFVLNMNIQVVDSGHITKFLDDVYK